MQAREKVIFMYISIFAYMKAQLLHRGHKGQSVRKLLNTSIRFVNWRKARLGSISEYAFQGRYMSGIWHSVGENYCSYGLVHNTGKEYVRFKVLD